MSDLLRFAPIIKTIRSYDDKEWEIFVTEWVQSLKTRFVEAKRYARPGDKGRDVVGFEDSSRFAGRWYNCQCKHYESTIPVTPAIVDIAKIIYHSHQGDYAPPVRSDFAAPKGPSTSLQDLLDNPGKLREYVLEKWNDVCAKQLVAGSKVLLEGDLRTFAESFPFQIFGWKSLEEIIADHMSTAHWAQRFGGALPPPPDGVVPASIAPNEITYIRHLLDAYGERLKKALIDHSDLAEHDEWATDLQHQRVRFFDAEAFSHEYRDQTASGTVEDFQQQILDAVSPLLKKGHADGVERLADVLITAGVAEPANLLSRQAKIRMKQGVCHQWANADRLRWRIR